MTDTMNTKTAQLWEVCREFIIKQKIYNRYDTVEDRVYINAPDFIEEICKIVGYHTDA